MKITICSSSVFIDKVLEVKRQLETIGHDVLITDFAEEYAGKEQAAIEMRAIHNKKNNNAIDEHFEKIKRSDAILVLNYDKNDVRNYIGGNTFLELGFAYILRKKIFLLNPIPAMIYTSEIEAFRPIVIYGNLNKIA